MLRKLCVPALLFLISLTAFSQQSRHFAFRYAFTVKDVPVGKKVRIWVPVPQGDPFQDVSTVSTKGDLFLSSTREPQYKNEMYYASTRSAAKQDLHFEVLYDVVRRERVALPASNLANTGPKGPNLKQDLKADALVPITGIPADLAMQATQGKTDPLDKAHAIYDYVFTTMKYDKTGTGWGRGDVLYACDAKKGNCTDFHSLFIAMARSQGIPARFEIGFPLPSDKHSGEIAGYHCWADFFIDGRGWIPVDISEAWKHPEKRDYFFGSHDVNRVQFSMGRDLRLRPPQDGKPLNYFVYPYVEVDGREYPNVSLEFSFADDAPTVARK